MRTHIAFTVHRLFCKVVCADNKDPRLVIDATAAGVNPNCRFPERVQYPTIKDISNTIADYYAGCSERLSAITLDVKAAHKRVLINESPMQSRSFLVMLAFRISQR